MLRVVKLRQRSRWTGYAGPVAWLLPAARPQARRDQTIPTATTAISANGLLRGGPGADFVPYTNRVAAEPAPVASPDLGRRSVGRSTLKSRARVAVEWRRGCRRGPLVSAPQLPPVLPEYAPPDSYVPTPRPGGGRTARCGSDSCSALTGEPARDRRTPRFRRIRVPGLLFGRIRPVRTPGNPSGRSAAGVSAGRDEWSAAGSRRSRDAAAARTDGIGLPPKPANVAGCAQPRPRTAVAPPLPREPARPAVPAAEPSAPQDRIP